MLVSIFSHLCQTIKLHCEFEETLLWSGRCRRHELEAGGGQNLSASVLEEDLAVLCAKLDVSCSAVMQTASTDSQPVLHGLENKVALVQRNR